MRPGRFVYTRHEWLFSLAGATVAHATLRNNTCNPQIAAHTSIWLVEAELRQTPVAKILEEAHRTGVGVSGPDLRAEALRLLNKNDLEPSILFVTGPSAEREAAESSRKQVHDLAWTDDGTGDAIRQLQSHSPG